MKRFLCLYYFFFEAIAAHVIHSHISINSSIEYGDLNKVLVPWLFIPSNEVYPYLSDETVPKYNGDITKDVKFNLYTRHNQFFPKRLYVNNVETFKESTFNHNHLTKILIHGFTSDGSSPVIIEAKNAYLMKGDFNVIGVDWGLLSQGPFSDLKQYIAACKNAKLVGKHLAELVEFLVEHGGINPSDIHVIGHSLGGHVAGFAGNAMKKGKIGRITGLDVASPGFEGRKPSERLDASDAIVVDSIHTGAGLPGLGMIQPHAHVDFYPNGGSWILQGCIGGSNVDNLSCGHNKAVTYFIHSISNPKAFYAVRCLTLAEAETGLCTGRSEGYMGDSLQFTLTGIYYVLTPII